MGGRARDDAEITAALRAADGNVSAAARALGVMRLTVVHRVAASPAIWPEGVARRVLPERVSVEAVAAALRAHGGDYAAAARALGYSTIGLYAFVRQHPTAHPPEIPRSRPVGAPALRMDRPERITGALLVADGDLAAAAAILGCTVKTVRAWLKRRPDLWPKGVARQARRHPHRGRALSDAEKERSRVAICAAQGAVAPAARALGITRKALESRIRIHPEIWPEELPRAAGRATRVKPVKAPDPDPGAGRRVGALTLLETVRGKDGKLWVRALCDCGREKLVRASHVCAGARKPVRSCGCGILTPPRACYLGETFEGGDLCIVDDGADHVALRCPDGHTWEVTRDDARARHLAPPSSPGSPRARTTCTRCRVRATVDLRGQVFGMLEVLRRAGTDAPASGRYASQATWWVRCECGAEKAVRGGHLRAGSPVTCGAPECLRAWRGR